MLDQISVHSIQAIKVFNLIQEITENPKYILTAPDLNNFLTITKLAHHINALKFLHQIDIIGQEMTEDYFGYCIANKEDISSFHQYFRQLIMGNYYPPFSIKELWDLQQVQQQEQISNKFRYIDIIQQQFQKYGRFDHNTIQILHPKINDYLSILTLNTSQGNQIINKYKFILNTNFMDIFQHLFNMGNSFKSCEKIYLCLKTLCYLYHSLKYQSIYQMLFISNSFIFKKTTWDNIIQNLNINSNVPFGQNIIFYTFVLTSLISNFVRQFCQSVWQNKQMLNFIKEKIKNLTKPEHLFFALQFLTNLVNYNNQPLNWINDNILQIKNIFALCLNVIKKIYQNEIMYTKCINLIRSIIKVYQLDSSQSQMFKNIISQSFKLQYKTAIIEIFKLLLEQINLRKQDIVKVKNYIMQMIFSDNYFFSFIEKQLKYQTPKGPQCIIYQVIYRIIKNSQYLGYFLHKNLLKLLIQQSKIVKDSFTYTIITEIIKQIIQINYKQEWMIVILYQNDILNALGELMRSCMLDDINMAKYLQYLQKPQYVYFNKRIFCNVLKCLFLLSHQQINNEQYILGMKILFNKKITDQLILKIYQCFMNFFQFKSPNYIKNILNEEIELKNITKTKIKLYQLIHLLIENMCKGLIGRQQSLLKPIIAFKRVYYKKLYSLFNINQLENNRIPIYLQYKIKHDGQYIFDLTLGRIQWSSLRMYIISKIQLKINQKISNIKAKYYDIFINDDINFKEIIRKIIQDYNNSKFQLQIVIDQITPKQMTNDSHYLSVYPRPQQREGHHEYSNNYSNHFNQSRSFNNEQYYRSKTPDLGRKNTGSFRKMADNDNQIKNKLQCPRCFKRTKTLGFCQFCRLQF